MTNLYNNFSAKALFFTGLLIMPALLFNPITELRIAQFLFFWFLAFLFGKKTNPVVTLLVLIFIIAFNLIIPYGRVLFSIGIFKITSGALTAGIHRAFTLSALVMLSKVMIKDDLHIPGAFGGILSESLKIFSLLTGKKYRLTGKNFIADIDNMMIEISRDKIIGTSEQGLGTGEKLKTKPIGFVILALIVIISWLPWVINILKVF